MVLLGAAVWATVTFSGGDWSDLCKSIAESRKQNVVALAGANCPAKRFEYDLDDLNLLVRAVQAATGFRQAAGSEHIFHRGRILPEVFYSPIVQKLGDLDGDLKQGGPLPEDAVKDGSITIRHRPRQATTLSALGPVLPKPLKLHFLFENQAFKAWATDIEPREMLRMLAKAAGGLVVERKDHLYLDIDPAEIQRRALATMDEARKQKGYDGFEEYDKCRLALMRAATAGASPSELRNVLGDAGFARMEIGFAMRPAVERYLRHLMQRPQHVGETDANHRAGVESANLRRIDPRLFGYVRLDGRFDVKLFLQTVDATGRPGSLMEVP